MDSRLQHGMDRLRLGQSKLSRHAGHRSQQRAIPQFVIDALHDFGDSKMVGKGDESFFFGKRAWKRFEAYMGCAAQGMEKYRNVYIIVADDGTVITAAWRH